MLWCPNRTPQPALVTQVRRALLPQHRQDFWRIHVRPTTIIQHTAQPHPCTHAHKDTHAITHARTRAHCGPMAHKKVGYAVQFPHKLLHWLAPDCTNAERARIADELLDAPDCCLRSHGGFASRIRHLAQSFSPIRARQMAYILGPYIQSLVLQWGQRLSISIADLECFNAKLKRFKAGL